MAKNYKLSEEEKEKAKRILGQINKTTESNSNNEIRKENINNSVKNSIIKETNSTNKRLPSYRTQNNTLKLPISSKISKMPDDFTIITPTDLRAMREAEEINKEIKKSGPEAVLATISNAGRSFQGGVQQGIEGIGNAIVLPMAMALNNNNEMAKKFGFADKNKENGLDSMVESLLDASDYITAQGSYSSKVNSRIDNNVTRTIGNVANVTGNMVPAIISNVVAPGSGLAVTGISTGGNSAQETINDDRSNLNQAILTGIAKGGTEALTEKLTGGNILSKGSLDDFVGKTISSKIKSDIGKKIANKAYQFAGEMLEEQISDNAGYLIDKVINNKDLPDFKEWWNNAGEINKITFLSTLALNLVGLGGKNVENVDTETQRMVNEVTEQANDYPEMQSMIQNTINNINNERNTNNQTENNMLPTAKDLVYNNVSNNNSNNLKEEAKNIIENSKVSDAEKSQMLEGLDDMEEVKNADIEAIRQIVNIAKKVDIENNILDTKGNYQNDATRRQKYIQYKNDTSDYDNTIVEQVLDTYQTNRNGKRTVKQWMKIAQDIGTNIAYKSNTEIEKIAYKSWFDIEPSKNISQYDSQSKKNISFQRLTSDEWINKINRAVNETRQQNDETNIVLENQESNNTLPIKNEEYSYINQTFEQSAKKNNIDTNNETTKAIKRVTQKRGIKATFDSDVFNGNDNINAVWKSNDDGTREIILNPKKNQQKADTDKTLQNVITHELTHDLEGTDEYKQLRDLILNYNENKTGYTEARKSLEEIYSRVYDKNVENFKALVDSEAIADILGNKLGNQDFINNLTTEKPSLGKRIYNWIIDKLNKINKLSGYKNEKLFWTDVKNKFEKAYSQDYQGNNVSEKSRFSINSNFKQEYDNWNKVDRQGSFLIGRTSEALKSIGLNDYDIVMDKSKMLKIKNNHPEMSDDIIKSIPEILENPTLILNSQSNNKKAQRRKVIFGEILDTKGNPVLVALELNPSENKNNIDKIYKVASAYGKENLVTIQKWINNEENILYIDKQKNRTMNWLNGLGLQLPVPDNLSSSNNSITSKSKDVNITKYSMQESENNSSSTNKDNLSEEAKKQLHRYAGFDKEALNKAFSDVVNNKENMLQEINNLRKEYKEFQNTKEFKKALEDFAKNDTVPQNVQEMMDKASKYADKIRYYQNAYDTYHAQQEAINSILMGNETETRSAKDIAKEAEKHFGTTTNFKETAYIDINGEQIDFSGKHEGGISGARALDHRQINEIDIDMESFISMGNIRILPEGGGINLKIEPTLKQYNKLRKYIDSVDGEIYIDINKVNNQYDYAEYVRGTSSSKIINDIKYYFENGEFPKQSELAKFRYSLNKKNSWQSFLDQNYKNEGEGQTIQEVKEQSRRTLNPTEIASLKPEDASTTPKLQNKKYENGNKQSSFYSNVTEKSKFLNQDFRNVMKQNENIEYYKTVSNKDTLEKAYNKLKNDGQKEVVKWHSKDSKNATVEDVAKGWILLKQYQDAGDYDSAVEVAKKMRDIGTTAGQTIQAYNILSRLTPEGMFYYVQSELSEAYSKMVEGKSKKWIDANKDKFDLTPEETKFIIDTMQDVSKMEDGYEKKVKLAEIQKLYTDKIPAIAGQSVKAWMRISMLFNPKTQVRNIMGNVVITPVNMFSDSVSAGIDKLISKKTGLRTTGNTNIKSYVKGFGKGLYESYNDFKKGINTRNIAGNRFEVSEGKNFNNKGLGKALNRVDNLLSFMLDAGDRGFYEATFTNSINNQLVLNNTTEITQNMIDIATTEALQRTWQDNNNYTKAVLGIRKILNNVNIKGYGLGDVLIPFAKTPANLTKAIVDYSPVGLVKTLSSDAIKLKNSLENGQYTPQLQHQFVQNLGKATAGTFLYVLGYALAQSGVITGEADEDKDVKNFMHNSLGINSYSIKMGDKSFSYDWAQPIATPFAIMANYVKYSNNNPEASAIDKAINAMNIGTEQLLQQSFMESLNTVLNGSGTTLENLSQAVLELPSRAIPTFSKQIADMIDSTQRTSFEYDEPIQRAVNSVIAKIPFASKTLPASIDTLGNEIKKYSGDNNVFNVFLNPANMNKGELSKVGEEIYNIYKETGDSTVFPRTAPYYINNKGEKVKMTARERSEFQKISGTNVEDTLAGLLNNKDYKKLSNEEKGKLINEIVSDSYSKAKYDVLNLDSEEYEKLRKTLKTVKATNYYDYISKIKESKTDKDKIEVLANAKYADKEKTTLYETYILSDSDAKYPIIKETFTKKGLNITKYLEYKAQEFTSNKEDDGTVDGKSISGRKKEKVVNYIDSIEGATYTQKIILLGLEYSLSDYEKSQIVNYIESLEKTEKEKLDILSNFKGFKIYRDGTFDY